jgi:hypothetical protein
MGKDSLRMTNPKYLKFSFPLFSTRLSRKEEKKADIGGTGSQVPQHLELGHLKLWASTFLEIKCTHGFEF